MSKNPKITRRFNISIFDENEKQLALLRFLLPGLSDAAIFRASLIDMLNTFTPDQIQNAQRAVRAARKASKAAQS